MKIEREWKRRKNHVAQIALIWSLSISLSSCLSVAESSPVSKITQKRIFDVFLKYQLGPKHKNQKPQDVFDIFRA